MNRPVITLTFSPALDVATEVDVVTPSNKLRCDEPRREPGGGGINVARAAQRLGAETVAVAPLGGDRGRIVIDEMAHEGVRVERVPVDYPIRQSFAVTERSSGRQYRFVLPPHHLDADETDGCVRAICEHGADAGCVVVSGSIDVPDADAALREIVESVAPTPVLIDTSGDALAAALRSGAALVKPSARELAELVGGPLDTEDDIAEAAMQTVLGSSVAAMLVSIGGGGAILVRSDGSRRRFRAPTVRVRSTIGAGDSLVAGVAVGLARGDALDDSIRLGIAAGTATVMTEGTALCDPSVVADLLPLVNLDR